MDTPSKPALIRSILLATDGSAPAERAARCAASLAMSCQAKVTVLHVFSPITRDLGEPNYSRLLLKTLDDSRALVEAVAAQLRELGVSEVETDMFSGTAAEGILSVADVRQPDLIVLGARGLSTLQSILLGSVSQTVTQHANCPVVIVK
jgi:nucleotide-binding universal stress UspA family protein